MFLSWPILVALGIGVFCVGTVIGSFLNVCIYRIPWQKSVIWPASTCPKCLQPIAARDNIPIVSWLALRGECRVCGLRISMRYPLIEALVGFLFLGVYLVDVVSAPRAAWDQIPTSQLVVMSYHLIFVSLLVAATFIDYDLMIIPDEITVTGMIVGVGLGTVWPWVRPEPSDATTPWGGFWVGVFGLLIGAGVTDLVRRTGSAILRKEAMGFGDVTLQAMIGSFLGWQAAVVGFFLSSFFGLAHAVWKLLKYLEKWVLGRELSTSDRELPLGPYLSMAALTLLLGWRWLWPSVLREYFETFRMIFWWMLGVSVS